MGGFFSSDTAVTPVYLRREARHLAARHAAGMDSEILPACGSGHEVKRNHLHSHLLLAWRRPEISLRLTALPGIECFIISAPRSRTRLFDLC
jgi:hypothetical protein